MLKKIIPSMILLFSVNVSAITLKESLERAYENDDDMKVIRNDFLIEIERFPKALSEFMPRVSADFYSSNRKEKNREESLINSNNSTNNGTTHTNRLNITQPIFDGGSSVAGLKAAKSSFRSSRAKYYLYEQERILKQIEVYLDCLISEEKYQISQKSVDSNLKQFNAMQEKFKLGESTKTEVATTRAALAGAKAKLSSTNAELKTAQANFVQVFNIEPDNLSLPTFVEEMPESLEQLLVRSANLNPEIEFRRNALSALKSNHIESLGSLLPRVEFRASAERNLREPHSRDLSPRRKSKVFTTSLIATVPILSKGGAEYSEIRKAKKSARKAVAEYEKTMKSNKSKTISYWSEYQAAFERRKATEEAVKSAQIAYEGIIQEEKLGAKTIIDVINVERELLRAREDRASTKKQLILASYKIKSLTGEISAKSLGLNVNYFSPEKEFKNVKMKIVGF